jgi:hypothetical protein
MSIFESYNQLDQQGFLRWMQRAWQQVGAVEPLKLSAPSQTNQEPAPLQIATNSPDAPAPDLTDPQKWLDIRLPRSDPERDVFSTAIGSGVISPTIHKLMQMAQSGNVAQRFEFCQQLRILLENDFTVWSCILRMIEGACRLGMSQEVIPIEGQEGNPIAKQSADRANLAYQAAAKLFPVSERELTMREYILFGNIFNRLAWSMYGTITGLMGLPCQTMNILVNSQLKLDDGQYVAYQQFDPMKWGDPIFQFSDLQVLCVRNRILRSDVWGTTFLLPIIKYAQDNIKTMDLVQVGREEDLPINVQQREDAIGNGIHPSALQRAKWESIEERRGRGEDTRRSRSEWINGRGKMERLESTGSYYNGFSDNDVNYRSKAIAGVIGRSLAMIVNPEVMNRATSRTLTENDYDRENKLAVLFCDTHDVALMQKAVFITNICAAMADDRWAMEPGRYYIDPRLIKLKSDIVGQVTEDCAMERVDMVGYAVSKGTMPIKRAAFITAQSFKQDPDQYWQELLRENPNLRNAYPEDYIDPTIKTLPPSITSQPNEDNSDPEQVM